MEKAILRASLVLAGSIVFAAVWTTAEFRYDVEVWGRTIMVHDRFRGTVEHCVGGGASSRCFPLLATGMQPISPPRVKTARKFTDQEFKDMLDRAEQDFKAQGG